MLFSCTCIDEEPVTLGRLEVVNADGLGVGEADDSTEDALARASEQGGASAAGEMERELLGQAMKKQQEQKTG